MKNTTVRMRGSEIALPAELWMAVGRPAFIRVFRNGSESIYFVAGDFFERTKALVRRLLRRQDLSSWYGWTRANDDGVWFALRHGSSISGSKDQEFRIINYDRSIHLLQVTDEDEAVSRQSAWAGYTAYHEHLPYDKQQAGAVRCSQWLATVCANLRPRSVLELGCGSGRNLYWLHKAMPTSRLEGVDVNPAAVGEARRQLGDTATIFEGSLYDLSRWADESVDVVVTSGVLMHIPTDRVDGVIREMHRIGRMAVVCFELHGASHSFDYHRYPRNYKNLYESLGLGTAISYRVFPRCDFRSRTTGSFRHALLRSVKR
jgi:ubiquinone/menaquinone biosynthesis C-methylase UbiE